MDTLDRYGEFTDLSALREASARPLRQSVRVNLLKTTVPAFLTYAAKRKWRLAPVPWCGEGFFIDHDGEPEDVGRDLLHRLGYFYVQEAASMLPPVLLGARPGEAVLDLCSAPGSKTTQIAAMMEGRGVIVANDPQEKRLWVLRSSLQRIGVTNAVLTKKVGQWYAKHMTERFDRVLCDAPCTAQGTARRNSSSLERSSEDSVRKIAALQRELLEASVHAAKVGGRIVYSTCTLTPEENEEVVLHVLNKFCDQVISLGPAEMRISNLSSSEMESAWSDAEMLFQTLQSPISNLKAHALRLWPQTFDTSGFFCAVFEKIAPTRSTWHTNERPPETSFFSEREQERIAVGLTEHFGTSFLAHGDRLLLVGDRLSVVAGGASSFPLPIAPYALGLPFGRMQEGRLRLSHEICTLRGEAADHHVHALSEADMGALHRGQKVPCPLDISGDIVLRLSGLSVGLGTAGKGMLISRFPKAFVQG